MAQRQDRADGTGRDQVEIHMPGRRPGAGPHAHHAIVAARHLDPLEADRIGDLREGERQHREVDARQPHDEEAEQRGEDPTHDRGGDQRRFHRHAALRHQQPRRIGTQPEIGGVAEADDAAIADQEVQREGGQREDQHLGRDLHRIGIAEKGQGAGGGDGQPQQRAFQPAEAARVEDAFRQGGAAGGDLWPAQQAPGLDDQHHRHQQEDQHQRDLREDQHAEGLQLADQHRREEGAGHAAHAADHRDDEDLRDDREVHLPRSRDARDLQRAAKPRQEGAEEQRAGEQHRLVDAERAHHLPVPRRGADQDTEARAVHQQPQQPEHRRTDEDQEQLIGRETLAQYLDAMAQPRRARPGDVHRPPDPQHRILHHQHHAEGRQQLEQLRHLVDAAQQKDFHRHAEQPDHHRAGQHAHEEQPGRTLDLQQPGHDGHRHIGAEHVERPMREIHDPGDAEDQRQPGCDDEQR